MIGEVVEVRKDGKRWRRQEVPLVSTAQYHLRNWKVMLWVVAALLTLVDGGFPGEDREDPHPAKLRAQGRMAWQPTAYPELQGHEEGSDAHTSWAGLLDSPSLMEEAEGHQSRWQRSPSDPVTPKKPRNRRKNRSQGCRMERKNMRVRDLGLGYNSDETVVFKYCVGTCQSSRRNYDLALKILMESGGVPKSKVSVHPCCRPTRYETVSFMDSNADWQTIKWLSAANCSCVG